MNRLGDALESTEGSNHVLSSPVEVDISFRTIAGLLGITLLTAGLLSAKDSPDEERAKLVKCCPGPDGSSKSGWVMRKANKRILFKSPSNLTAAEPLRRSSQSCRKTAADNTSHRNSGT
jgi:hypothetical protein